MALPTQRSTKSRKRKRLTTLNLGKKDLVKCPQCKKEIIAHRACPFCGTYAGRETLKIKSKHIPSRKQKALKHE